MTELDPRALEAAKVAVLAIADSAPFPDIGSADAEEIARAAVTAYLQSDSPVSPELIAGLNKLATYLTEHGEYEAVDLIDTVVERVIDAAPPAALAGSGEK